MASGYQDHKICPRCNRNDLDPLAACDCAQCSICQKWLRPDTLHPGYAAPHVCLGSVQTSLPMPPIDVEGTLHGGMSWVRVEAVSNLLYDTKCDVWVKDERPDSSGMRMFECRWTNYKGIGPRWVSPEGRLIEDENRKVTHLLFVSDPTS